MQGQRVTCPQCGTVFTLNEGYYETRILQLLQKTTSMTFTELLEATQFTRKTLSKYLQRLCSLGKILKQKGYKIKETEK